MSAKTRPKNRSDSPPLCSERPQQLPAFIPHKFGRFRAQLTDESQMKKVQSEEVHNGVIQMDANPGQGDRRCAAMRIIIITIFKK